MTLTPKVEEKDRLSAIVNTRGALLGVLAAIVVVIGAAAAFLNYHETSAQNKRTNELTRHGQLADWFPKAIEELGKNNQDDRLGGIYALEQIAKEGRDLHPAVMEILTAFLRDHSRPPQTMSAMQAGTEKLTDKPEDSADMPESMLRLRTDFQAIATVLGRRESSYDPSGYTLDLRGAVLGGVDLTNAALEWADFGLARLQDADFEGAKLQHGCFRKAQLDETYFTGAQLQQADFRGAEAKRAHFLSAHAQDANLEGANLERAWFAARDGDKYDAIGLTSEQIAKARNVHGLILPDHGPVSKELKSRIEASPTD